MTGTSEPPRGWTPSAPNEIFPEKLCIVFVDMKGSTALWETIWNLEDHVTRHNIPLGGSLSSGCWEFLRSCQNAVIRAFINLENAQKCHLVKGIGDGFIFQ